MCVRTQNSLCSEQGQFKWLSYEIVLNHNDTKSFSCQDSFFFLFCFFKTLQTNLHPACLKARFQCILVVNGTGWLQVTICIDYLKLKSKLKFVGSSINAFFFFLNYFQV